MSPSFHLDLSPFSFAISMDVDGIVFERGNTKQHFDWRRIAGAVLVREQLKDTNDDRELALARGILGENFDLEKIKALRDSMATIHIAYRDDRGRLTHEDFPIPLTDGAFLQELRERLGPRWLGEVADVQAAEKKLHTAPGAFKVLFFLFVFLAVIALALGFGLFTLLAPALNALSIREMYFELVDGDYSAFGAHALVYVALFVFAHLLRRAWRTRVEARRSRNKPFR
jgi:hypothetical protein